MGKDTKYTPDEPPVSGEVPQWALEEFQRLEEKLQDLEGIVTEFGLIQHELGWKDLIGDVSPKSQGAGRPSLDTFRNDIRWFSYATNDDGDIVFHMPHDYAPGTDIFLHVHWSHNGTAISGSMDVRFHVTYAKGFGQETYPSDIEPHLVVTGLDLTNSPQYHTRVDELQLSQSGGGALMLDTDMLEADGLILVHYDLDVIPAITSSVPRPFIFAIDIHYQTDRRATVSKAPDFNMIQE